MDQETPPPPQGRPLLTQKPKRTVTLGACVACRKRKSKCDGNRPVCTCCFQKDTECVYELGPNEKPSQAMKRKNEEMQGELSNLRQLYDFLRLRPEQEAMEIMRRIRANPPNTSPSQRIQELADFVRHGDLLIQHQSTATPSTFSNVPGQSVTLPPLRLALESPSNLDSHNLPFPGILSMGSDGPTSQRRRCTPDVDVSARQSSLPAPTSLEAILHPSPAIMTHPTTEPQLASAKNWTTVTSDINILADLLSAWTVREYSYYHYLDREAFLDDMASGRTDYCSSLLVNALLASACFHSSAIKDRQKPFSETSMTTMFYKEARRLWDLEEGKDSLTKLQAGICLFMVLGKYGRDKVGYTFLLEACRIGRDLGLFQSQPVGASPQLSSEAQRKWGNVRAVTAWALFNFQLSMSFVYSIPVIIRTLPPMDIPYRDAPNTEAFFRSECAKNIIILDCVNMVQGDNDSYDKAQPVPEEIEACYRRLTLWWDSRSPVIHPDRVPSKENLLCAMMYQVDIINLFRPVLDAERSLEQTDSYRDHARSVTFASLREIRRLLALQETRHGWSNSITLILHPITVASFGSLDQISVDFLGPIPIEETEPYQGLLVCLRGLGNISSYSYYAQPLFRLLTQKCQTLGVQLPIEIQNTLEYYKSEEWTKNAANLVSSQYIAHMGKTVTEAESVTMDAIISSWEELSLDETTAAGAVEQDGAGSGVELEIDVGVGVIAGLLVTLLEALEEGVGVGVLGAALDELLEGTTLLEEIISLEETTLLEETTSLEEMILLEEMTSLEETMLLEETELLKTTLLEDTTLLDDALLKEITLLGATMLLEEALLESTVLDVLATKLLELLRDTVVLETRPLEEEAVSELLRTLLEAVRDTVVEGVPGEVRDEVRVEVRDDVRDEVRDEVRNEVRDGVRDGLCDEVREGLREEVRDRSGDGLCEELREELRAFDELTGMELMCLTDDEDNGL
ncbi:Nn.00g081940.m01.CDS01 [Neocucurbitaria sp. VM-36]